MKILVIGDASNFHVCLGKALRQLGHEMTIVSDGCGWMDTERTYDLPRTPGPVGGLQYVLQLLRLLPKLRGYDVVQLNNPIFLALRPQKVKWVFDYLKRNNRFVALSALGTDYIYVQACRNRKIFKYSDYTVGDKPSPYVYSDEYALHLQDNWDAPVMKRFSDYITPRLDGVIACLYEYHKAYEGQVPAGRLAYGGIPIDTQSVTPRFIDKTPDRVNFFLGRHKTRKVLKGTDLMLDALRRTCDRYPGLCQMQVVENVPYAQYIELFSQAHVCLDQLYSYTPATNALLAMTRGVVAVSGAEPEFYDFIGEHHCQPIINVSPLVEGDIDARLAWIVEHRDQLPRLSRQSREFVERHNDSLVVARRYIDFWNTIMNLPKR